MCMRSANQALGELGKVLKTIFLCQYLHSEALRRGIHEGLNVVEQWNSTNGFILLGNLLLTSAASKFWSCFPYTYCKSVWFTSTL